MNELVWEGLLEILRGDQPSLKATARLWRRDDFFGSDWGGQLELPVVFRRLLPPGDYAVRLPAGGQGTARVTAGPSTTSMTFPTLTGVGHPPFGGAEARPAIEVDREEEAPVTQEPPPVAAPATEAVAMSPVSAVIEVAEMQSEPLPAIAASTSPVTAPAPAPVAPLPAPARVPSSDTSTHPFAGLTAASSYEPPPATTARRLAVVDSTSRSEEPQGPAQTEAMARAFLAAVEARERLQAVARPGFEGRAIEAARQGTYAATETLEGALRARAGTDHWAEELAEHLVALSWFASLAVSDSQPEVAGAGRAVQALVATMRTLLLATAPAREYVRAA